MEKAIQNGYNQEVPSAKEIFRKKVLEIKNGGHPIEQYFGIMDGTLQIHPFYRETINLPTNIILLPDKTSVNPYPNPVKDVFTLGGLPSGTAVEIYDMSGKVAKVQYFTALQNGVGIIDVSDLPDQTYLLKAGASVCKIIKSR